VLRVSLRILVFHAFGALSDLALALLRTLLEAVRERLSVFFAQVILLGLFHRSLYALVVAENTCGFEQEHLPLEALQTILFNSFCLFLLLLYSSIVVLILFREDVILGLDGVISRGVIGVFFRNYGLEALLLVDEVVCLRRATLSGVEGQTPVDTPAGTALFAPGPAQRFPGVVG
jgi:hypothetical protein